MRNPSLPKTAKPLPNPQDKALFHFKCNTGRNDPIPKSRALHRGSLTDCCCTRLWKVGQHRANNYLPHRTAWAFSVFQGPRWDEGKREIGGPQGFNFSCRAAKQSKKWGQTRSSMQRAQAEQEPAWQALSHVENYTRHLFVPLSRVRSMMMLPGQGTYYIQHLPTVLGWAEQTSYRCSLAAGGAGGGRICICPLSKHVLAGAGWKEAVGA